jgi:hypothetical protein
MFTFDTIVKASSIWSSARDYTDEGKVLGLVRGYNIEVKTPDEKLIWLTAEWIEGGPEEHFNDEFHQWFYQMHNYTPTGRITFRGYGEQEWDPDERDTYICNIGPRKRTDDIPDSEFEFLKKDRRTF